MPSNLTSGLPPHDIAAEEAVIAALLLDADAVHRVLPLIQPQDFFREHYGWAYEAAIQLAERGEVVTVPTLAHELDRAGRLGDGDDIGLQEIVGKYFTSIGVEAHAKIVARDATYRRLMQAMGHGAQLAGVGGPEVGMVIAAIEKLVRDAGAGGVSDDFETSETVALRLLEGQSARATIPTGFFYLDQMLAGGFGRGELVCIGAHTSHGKTALAVVIAYYQAMHSHKVGYIPVEGSSEKVVERQAGPVAGITRNYAFTKGHGFREDEEELFRQGLESVSLAGIYYPTRGRVPRTPLAIGAWITMMARGHGLEIFYIDHIDAIHMERDRGESAAAAYKAALTYLQNVANRERVAIVFLSQCNRPPQGTPPKMPRMHQLRESGAKEELAQVVLMLWADERGEEEVEARRRAGAEARFIHALVDKNTEGRVGDVPGSNGQAPAFLMNLQSMEIRQCPPN